MLEGTDVAPVAAPEAPVAPVVDTPTADPSPALESVQSETPPIASEGVTTQGETPAVEGSESTEGLSEKTNARIRKLVEEKNALEKHASLGGEVISRIAKQNGISDDAAALMIRESMQGTAAAPPDTGAQPAQQFDAQAAQFAELRTQVQKNSEHNAVMQLNNEVEAFVAAHPEAAGLKDKLSKLALKDTSATVEEIWNDVYGGIIKADANAEVDASKVQAQVAGGSVATEGQRKAEWWINADGTEKTVPEMELVLPKAPRKN